MKCDFLEVCHLLLYGDLPAPRRRRTSSSRVIKHTMVNEQMHFFMRGFRRDAHPMAVMTGLVGALSAFYPDSMNLHDARERDISAIRLIAKLPTLVAMAFKYSVGQPYMYPRNDLSYAANFMRMMFATPCEDYKVNDVLVRAVDRIFILHADHEQNASTSTVRMCASSGTNPFAAIAAGVACLWGPAHGGANEACLNMLGQIQAMGGVAKIGEFIAKVKDKNSGMKLMGFGHRVYKNYDPRAKLMRETCHEVLGELGPRRRSAVQARDGAREDRARGRVLRVAQALSERRLLFGHRAEGDRHSGAALHRDLRARAHRRLDRPVERDDRRSRIQDRPAAAALHGGDAPVGEADRRSGRRSGRNSGGAAADARKRHAQRTTRSHHEHACRNSQRGARCSAATFPTSRSSTSAISPIRTT